MRNLHISRRAVIAAAALITASVTVTSIVLAANGDGSATIAARVTDPSGLVGASPTQTIDAADCTSTPGALTCDLYAREDLITVPGIGPNVAVWGFTTDALGAPQLPGPTIVAMAGDTVTIHVHNELTSTDQLAFDARSVALSDRVPAGSWPAVGSGQTATYVFTANNVGTSIYGAGVSPQGNRQLAMGLAGTLVVRPIAASCPAAVAGCAYGDPASGGAGSPAGYSPATDAFQDEALIATSEIDLDLLADPLGFDITRFTADYHLINGRAFPATEVIDTEVSHTILLRYANLGLSDHSMGLVGQHQRVLGRDATALAHGSDDVTIPLDVGQTADVSVAVPNDALAGARYAISDQARQPGVSANAAMTFITVWGPLGPTTGPSAEVATITPEDSAGNADLAFDGTILAAPNTVTAAQYSLDDPGATPVAFSTFDAQR